MAHLNQKQMSYYHEQQKDLLKELHLAEGQIDSLEKQVKRQKEELEEAKALLQVDVLSLVALMKADSSVPVRNLVEYEERQAPPEESVLAVLSKYLKVLQQYSSIDSLMT